MPAESHASTWPVASVIVTLVLLNEAFTWAVALPTFLRTFAFFFGSAAGAAVFSGAAAGVGLLLDMGLVLSSLPQDLLVGDGLARPLARTRVAARALAADRQAAAVPQAAVAEDLLQAVDVLHHLAAQHALHGVVLLEVVRDRRDLVVLEVLRARVGPDRQFLEDLVRRRQADAVDVRQRDLDALLVGDVDAEETWHGFGF